MLRNSTLRQGSDVSGLVLIIVINTMIIILRGISTNNFYDKNKSISVDLYTKFSYLFFVLNLPSKYHVCKSVIFLNINTIVGVWVLYHEQVYLQDMKYSENLEARVVISTIIITSHFTS